MSAVTLGLAAMAAAHAATPGDRIEFSKPGPATLPKVPDPQRDWTDSGFSIQKETVDTSPAMMLPGYDYSARASALMRMMERVNSLGLSADGLDSNQFGDPLSLDPLSSDLSLDQLFQNADRGNPGNNPAVLDGADPRPGNRFPDRRNDPLLSPIESPAPDLSAPFLHRLDISASPALGALEPRNAAYQANRFLDAGAERAIRDAREREERKAAEARMDSFRALLGQGAPENPFTVGIPTAATAPRSAATPNARGNSRTLSGPLDNLTPLSPDPIRAPDPLPARPGFDPMAGLVLPGSASRPLDPGPPASTPMQLFQQKHDTRIPTRPF